MTVSGMVPKQSCRPEKAVNSVHLTGWVGSGLTDDGLSRGASKKMDSWPSAADKISAR